MLNPKLLAITILTICLGGAAPGMAQRLQGTPKVAEGIGVDRREGDFVPGDIRFNDDKNNAVTLGQYFQGGKKPVLLSFNYSDCPQMCTIQLNNLASAMQQIDLVPGRDFEIVSISLDPNEQSVRARETKKKYVVAYGDLDSADGWHFLTGKKKNIEYAAACCGIRYKYIADQKFYSHPAAFVFLSPRGKIVRYLNGLEGDLEGKLKPALMEASAGKIGNVADKLIYFAGCYIFDPTTGKYTFAVMGIVRVGGVITVLAIIGFCLPYWLRRRAKRKMDPPNSSHRDVDLAATQT